jgi:hypothetical protein
MYYVDSQTMVRAGSRVTFWLRKELTRPSDRGATVWLDRREMDCNARTTRLLAYSELRADGSLATGANGRAASNPNVVEEASPIFPGSIAENLFRLVCP